MPRARLFRLFIVLHVTLLACRGIASDPVPFGVGPETSVVIVNGDSWASMTVANAFCELRKIPDSHVITVSDVPDVDTISAATFEQLMNTVMATLQERGISRQVNSILYSVDMPFRVNMKKRKEEPAATNGKPGPHSTRIPPHCSITGLTYLYQLYGAGSAAYISLGSNRYYRRFRPASAATTWRDEDRERLAKVTKSLLAISKAAAEDRAGAQASAAALLPEFTPLAERYRRSSKLWYNYTCLLALAGKTEAALTALERAVACGWHDADYARKDNDLTPLRKHARFAAILENCQRRLLFDSLGFSAAAAWDQQGRPVAAAVPRYVLSMMLGYVGGWGCSVEETIATLQRGHAGDGTKPRGTFYFMQNDDRRTVPRLPLFKPAVKMLEPYPVEAKIVQGTVPEDVDDVLGVTMGSARFSWQASKSKLLPVAIGDNLTSFGGVLTGAITQTPLTEFLRHGAVAATGTVSEPRATAQKFPSPLMYVHYVRGSTVIEALYQSIASPYQILAVGEPLCRPWAPTATLGIGNLTDGQLLSEPCEVAVQLDSAVPAREYRMYVNGVLRQVTKPDEPLRLEPATLKPGHHELRVVAVLANALATRVFTTVHVQAALGDLPAPAVKGLEKMLWGESVTWQVRAPGALKVRLWQQSREVASLDGAEGMVALEARALGIGKVTVRPAFYYPGDVVVAGQPKAIFVGKPPVLAGQPPPAGLATGKRGVTLRKGRNQIWVNGVRGSWLQRAGIRRGDDFVFSGWFEVTQEGLHQLRISTNLDCTPSVDGHDLTGTAGDRWHYYPVNLAAGWHELAVAVKRVRGVPRLDIQFGLAGTKRPAAPDFWHVEVANP